MSDIQNYTWQYSSKSTPRHAAALFFRTVSGTISYKGPFTRFISLSTVWCCEIGVCGHTLLCLSYSTPTPYVLVHCVICAHLQVCSSICFGIFRNIVPNQSFQGQSLNSFPCRLTYLPRAQLGIYYSERHFSLLSFCFLVLHTLGQQY